jgi:FkbM family methyltransferase
MSLPLSARCLRAVLASRVRGATRLTLAAASLFPQLQMLRVPIGADAAVYIDLRITASHHLLEGVLHEDRELELVSKIVHDGDVCWDVGAHFGVYTVLFSRQVGASGKVFAFEPNSLLLPSLERTIRELPNVVLHRTALSNASGTTSFFVPPDFSAASLANWTSDKTQSKRITVEQRTADELLREGVIEAPSFIKCDVEGAEALVFAGAATILNSDNAPIILFELNRRASEGFGLDGSNALRFLRELPVPRYELFEIDPEQGDIRNLLAVPSHRRPLPDEVNGLRSL